MRFVIRKTISVSLAVAVTGIVMGGFVISAMDLRRLLPISTFMGFFQHAMFATDQAWSAAHGWKSMSHIDEFGRFYSHAVSFGCPLLGFLVYMTISRPRLGRHLIAPFAIAISQATPLLAGFDYPLREIGIGSPALYIVRAMAVLLLMIAISMVLRSTGDLSPSNRLDHGPHVEPAG